MKKRIGTRVFRLNTPSPPLYYATPSGGVLEPVVLQYLDDKARRDMRKMGARLVPRSIRRADMRRQRREWKAYGGAPKQLTRAGVREMRERYGSVGASFVIIGS